MQSMLCVEPGNRKPTGELYTSQKDFLYRGSFSPSNITLSCRVPILSILCGAKSLYSFVLRQCPVSRYGWLAESEGSLDIQAYLLLKPPNYHRSPAKALQCTWVDFAPALDNTLYRLDGIVGYLQTILCEF